MNRQQIVTLALFGACSASLCVGRTWKAPVVWAFAAVFVALGSINWNVIGTFAGTFIAAQLFASSGVPLLLALFRRYRERPEGLPAVRVKTWVPAFLLLGIIAALAALNMVAMSFVHRAGVTCAAAAFAHARSKAAGFEWGTVFLLMGLVWISVLLSGFIDNIPYVTAVFWKLVP